MSRREVMAVLAAAAATRPLKATAQQPESPVIGFLSSISEASRRSAVALPNKVSRGSERENLIPLCAWRLRPLACPGNQAGIHAGRRDRGVVELSSPLAAKSATREIPIASNEAVGASIRGGFVCRSLKSAASSSPI